MHFTWAVATGFLNVHYNSTHQLFDFCSLIILHHLHRLKYPIYKRNNPHKVLICYTNHPGCKTIEVKLETPFNV